MYPSWSNDLPLLGAGVLRNGLGSFRDGVLGQLARKQEPHGSLDLPAGDGGSLVVMRQPGGLGSDTFENIVDEAVHDTHRLAGDTGVGVHLFQYFVDVHCVGFLPFALTLLVVLRNVLLGFASFFGSFTTGFWRHVVDAILATRSTGMKNGSGRLFLCKLRANLSVGSALTCRL